MLQVAGWPGLAVVIFFRNRSLDLLFPFLFLFFFLISYLVL